MEYRIIRHLASLDIGRAILATGVLNLLACFLQAVLVHVGIFMALEGGRGNWEGYFFFPGVIFLVLVGVPIFKLGLLASWFHRTMTLKTVGWFVMSHVLGIVGVVATMRWL